MNIYADRGNIAVLRQRLAWRGMALEVTDLRSATRSARTHDLYYLGGGQDRDQAVVAEDLVATKAAGLRAAVAGGAAALCVCGGFQLAGHGYTGTDGSRMPGVGILDLDTVAGPTRLIGNLVIDADSTARPSASSASRTTPAAPGSAPERGRSGGCSAATATTTTTGRGRVRPRDRHLPPRPAVAQEPPCRGHPDRLGPGAPHRRAAGSRPLDDSLERAAHAAAVARATGGRAR